MTELKHHTVLLNEAVKALVIDEDGCYVDGTFGRGGHTSAILDQLGQSGRLLLVDKDPEAIEYANSQFGQDPRVMIEHASFADIESLVTQRGLSGQISGVLLDLGVSSPQLDDPERGFSFNHDGPLDMRMDLSKGQSAAQWLASAGQDEIAVVLKDYGEERFARRMARAIVESRAEQPITTTRQLAEIVAKANPSWEKGKHPATRAFQAIRIYVNSELDDLILALQRALDVLAIGGRLVVISFHSLEDRIVKRFFRDQERGPQYPRHLPITADQIESRLRRIGKAVMPSKEEVAANVRARSAVMRIAEKLA